MLYIEECHVYSRVNVDMYLRIFRYSFGGGDFVEF